MAEDKGRGSGGGEDGVNVQVLLRCRPLSDKELVDRVPQVVTCNEALREVTLFTNAAGKQMSRTFRFDRVFGCDSTQEKLFKQAIVPIVHEVMDGFNCTIFAYGQTGTGKTYTMEGGPRESDDGRKLSAQAGVIPRSIKQVFDTIEANNMDSTVKVSFLELYNEELTDLLAASDDDSKKLRLLEDKSGVVVQGLEEAIVRSATEIYQVLDRGTAKRRTAATLLNNRSSRSHSIFTITIHMKETTPEGEDVIKIGKLNLVDLAGSENISRSGAKDARAREAGSINQSLLTLGRVITALVEHTGHVPYRDSKLTRLLRDSLGGRTKTCIIATIAPTVQCQEETISTLDYAHRAKNIRNRPELNQKISKTAMIKDMVAEIERLKLDLQCTRDKNGVYLSSERYEQGELERMQLRETVKAMRAEAEAEELAHNAAIETMRVQHEKEVEALTSNLERKEAELLEVQDELNRANVTIQERVFVGASLKRAEQALAVHAEQLTNELGLCAQDITSLYSRLDEVSSLQSSDRDALRGMRDLVAARLQSLAGGLESILSRQSQHFTALSVDLAAFKEQKEADVSALRDQLSSLQAGVRGLEQSASTQLGSLASSAASALEQAATGSRALAKEAAAAGKAAHEAAVSAVEELVQGLEAQAAQLKAVTEKQAERTRAILQTVSSLTSSVHSGLKGISDTAASAEDATRKRHAQLQDGLQSFVQGFESSLKQQQAALLQQIGAMVDAFASERARALATSVQSIQAQLASSSTAASAELQSISAAAASVVSGLKDSEAASLSCIEQAAADVCSECTTCSTDAHACAAQGSAAVPTLKQATADQEAKLKSASTAIMQAASAAASSLQASATAASQQVSGTSSQLCSQHVTVLQSVEEQHAANVALVGSVSSMTSEAAEAMKGFGESHRSVTQELAGAVERGVAAQLAKEAAAPVPVRRAVTAPQVSGIQELMCPPEDVILQQLRNTKKEILRRGGDVRYAATLLLSPHRAAQTPASPPKTAGPPTAQENDGPAAMMMSPAPPPSAAQRSRIPLPSKAAGAAADATGHAVKALADRNA